jgi:hypothetical protein
VQGGRGEEEWLGPQGGGGWVGGWAEGWCVLWGGGERGEWVEGGGQGTGRLWDAVGLRTISRRKQRLRPLQPAICRSEATAGCFSSWHQGCHLVLSAGSVLHSLPASLLPPRAAH